MTDISILIVEDDPLFGCALQEALAVRGYSTKLAISGSEALAEVETAMPDMVLFDVNLPDASGIDLLRDLMRTNPGPLAMVMTGNATIDMAVEAMKAGAFDFITKPFSMEALFLKLERVLEYRSLEKEVTALRRTAGTSIVGRSNVFRNVLQTVKAAAASDASVLFIGESGTGKDVLARTLHDLSMRSKKPFVAINCAAIPEHLLEGELFGAERGAYTGAVTRAGLLESAEGGTVFLDEIGDLPLSLQTKLLRVIEEKKVARLGATTKRDLDFRLVAATNRDLGLMVQEKTFRQDLYFRLNVISIVAPPLRDRKDDIPLLVAHFIAGKAEDRPAISFAPDALDLLVNYSYPGNIRELRNIVEQLSLLHSGETIHPRHLPFSTSSLHIGTQFEKITVGKPLREAVEDFEKRYMEKVIESCGGNKTLSARILGITRKGLWQKLTRK